MVEIVESDGSLNASKFVESGLLECFRAQRSV